MVYTALKKQRPYDNIRTVNGYPEVLEPVKTIAPGSVNQYPKPKQEAECFKQNVNCLTRESVKCIIDLGSLDFKLIIIHYFYVIIIHLSIARCMIFSLIAIESSNFRLQSKFFLREHMNPD